jgi:hypothetical protein
MDLDDVAEKVEESLSKADDLANRLGDQICSVQVQSSSLTNYRI